MSLEGVMTLLEEFEHTIQGLRHAVSAGFLLKYIFRRVSRILNSDVVNLSVTSPSQIGDEVSKKAHQEGSLTI
jgi:hypothetical protein